LDKYLGADDMFNSSGFCSEDIGMTPLPGQDVGIQTSEAFRMFQRVQVFN
jgi:hypothetical protein